MQTDSALKPIRLIALRLGMPCPRKLLHGLLFDIAFLPVLGVTKSTELIFFRKRASLNRGLPVILKAAQLTAINEATINPHSHLRFPGEESLAIKHSIYNLFTVFTF